MKCCGSFPGRDRYGARARVRGALAFTLMETLFGIVLVSVLFVTIYGAINSSISLVRFCQENERVTQILSDKLDTIRLYNWNQITNSAFIPATFTEPLDALSTNSTRLCTGTIAIVKAPVGGRYKDDVMEVTVRVKWTSGKRPQSRSMTTYVAKYGIQDYIMRSK